MNRRPFAVLALLAVTAPLAALAAEAPPPPPAKPAAAKAPSSSSGLSGDEIADRVQGFYDRTKTFRAGFKQRYTIRAYDKTQDSNGQVIFEKPGKMSWRYTNNGNRVVSDGKVIKIYEKENKQMYEQPLDKTQYPAALSFLTGGGKLRTNFKFQKLDSKQMKFESGYVIAGEPKEQTAAYQRVLFYVDPTNYQVRRVLIIDAQGNHNRFDFVTPEVNTKAPNGEFAFTPPVGTQVIRP